MSSSYDPTELLEQIADLAERSTGWVKQNLRLSKYNYVENPDTKRKIALLLQRYSAAMQRR